MGPEELKRRLAVAQKDSRVSKDPDVEVILSGHNYKITNIWVDCTGQICLDIEKL